MIRGKSEGKERIWRNKKSGNQINEKRECSHFIPEKEPVRK